MQHCGALAFQLILVGHRVVVGAHRDWLRTRDKSDAVVLGLDQRQAMRLGKDVVEGCEQLGQQGGCGSGGADDGCLGPENPLPTDGLALPLERHGAGTKIP